MREEESGGHLLNATTNPSWVEAIVPDDLIAHRTKCGGRGIRRRFRPVADGLLRVMSAYDPIGATPGTVRQLLHVSVSIGGEEGPPARLPTDAECQQVLALWPAVKLVEERHGGSGQARHFWEE